MHQAPHSWGFLFIKGSNPRQGITGQRLVIEGTQPAKWVRSE